MSVIGAVTQELCTRESGHKEQLQKISPKEVILFEIESEKSVNTHINKVAYDGK